MPWEQVPHLFIHTWDAQKLDILLWCVFFGVLLSCVGREATHKQSFCELCNFTLDCWGFFCIRLINLDQAFDGIVLALSLQAEEWPSETMFFLLELSVQLFTTTVISPESCCLSMLCSSSDVSSRWRRSSYKSAGAVVCASEPWVSLDKLLVRFWKTFIRLLMLILDSAIVKPENSAGYLSGIVDMENVVTSGLSKVLLW